MEQNNADFLGTGWAFPMAVDGGRIAVASGPEDIREAVWIILSTRKGERVMRPDFGSNLGDLVFAPNNTSTMTLAAFYVREALSQWEPRIEVRDVQVQRNAQDDARLDIHVDYVIRALNSDQNLVYPFYLETV